MSAALSLAVLLTACSGFQGPLGGGGTDGIQCMDYRSGQPVTVGDYDLTNSGKSPVTIRNVTLPGLHGMVMGTTWLAPIYHDKKNREFVDIGVGGPYPPDGSPTWPQRKPAIGGVIGPHQDLTLVFSLTRTARKGKSDGPAVTYTASGITYTVREKTKLVVAARC